jgi:hypothetical protein
MGSPASCALGLALSYQRLFALELRIHRLSPGQASSQHGAELVITEMSMFPAVRFSDLTDSASQGLKHLRARNFALSVSIFVPVFPHRKCGLSRERFSVRHLTKESVPVLLHRSAPHSIRLVAGLTIFAHVGGFAAE